MACSSRFHIRFLTCHHLRTWTQAIGEHISLCVESSRVLKCQDGRGGPFTRPQTEE